MPRREVCLIDVYETLLTVDFAAGSAELAARAGVTATAFREAARAIEPGVTDGTITMAEAMRRMLGACGVEPEPALVRDLVAADRRLLSDSARLHDDTIGFLEMLKERRVRSALVSNCAENTRPLLSHLGLDVFVDAIVLSCEVGSAKPSASIYLHALGELAAEPDAAVLVDDQPAYCDGAVALGIAAARIVRDPSVAAAGSPGTAVVRSLVELERFF